MRRRVEYWIMKDYPKEPEHWDGPHPTLAAAKRNWVKFYRNTHEVAVEDRDQDFVIAKCTSEQVYPLRRKHE